MTRSKLFGAIVALSAIAGGAVGVPVGLTVLRDDAPVEIKYEAPAIIDVGTLGVIDVSATGADSFAFTVHPGIHFLLFEDGRKLVFATPVPGDYTFIVACAKGGQVGLAEITITVRGAAPPTPETFASRLKSAVMGVKSGAKDAELAGLLRTFDTVASMVAAGIITDPQELEDKIIEANIKVLGNNRPAWAPVSAIIKQELDSRAATTVQDQAAVCREIVAVLTEIINV